MNKIRNSLNNNLKIPKDLFIDISDSLYNSLKCIKCKYVPFIPIVLKNDQKSDNYNILCKDCFTKLCSEQKNTNINNIDKQYCSQVKLYIENNRVKCININKGCNWQGQPSKLELHLNNDCLYQEVKCPNNECNKIILKKDLDSHLAQCDFTEKIIKAKCNFCNELLDMN